jgi:hypothetical protein
MDEFQQDYYNISDTDNASLLNFRTKTNVVEVLHKYFMFIKLWISFGTRSLL